MNNNFHHCTPWLWWTLNSSDKIFIEGNPFSIGIPITKSNIARSVVTYNIAHPGTICLPIVFRCVKFSTQKRDFHEGDPISIGTLVIKDNIAWTVVIYNNAHSGVICLSMTVDCANIPIWGRYFHWRDPSSIGTQISKENFTRTAVNPCSSSEKKHPALF